MVRPGGRPQRRSPESNRPLAPVSERSPAPVARPPHNRINRFHANEEGAAGAGEST